MRHRKTWFVSLTVLVVVGSIIGGNEYYQRLRFAQRTACVGNLVQINLEKIFYADEHGLTNGSVIARELILPGLGYTPRCRMGGSYSFNAIGAVPTCSYTGTLRWKGFTWRHSLDRP